MVEAIYCHLHLFLSHVGEKRENGKNSTLSDDAGFEDSAQMTGSFRNWPVGKQVFSGVAVLKPGLLP